MSGTGTQEKEKRRMGDLYSELLVKRERTAKDSLVKYGLIVLTALAVFAGLFITPLLLIAAGNCVLFRDPEDRCGI